MHAGSQGHLFTERWEVVFLAACGFELMPSSINTALNYFHISCGPQRPSGVSCLAHSLAMLIQSAPGLFLDDDLKLTWHLMQLQVPQRKLSCDPAIAGEFKGLHWLPKA